MRRIHTLAGLLADMVTAWAEAQAILKRASVAPEGTSWAREVRAIARDVEAATDGSVKMKWYLGGMLGDDPRVMKRIEDGEIDGTASASIACVRAAPSLLIMWLPGLFQSRDEAAYVTEQLRSTFEEEALSRGFRLLATPSIGPVVVFSKTPVRSVAELRRLRLWLWDTGSFSKQMTDFAKELGMRIVATPIAEAARAYDEERIDGFLSTPTAAVAFQWSTQARFVADIRLSYLPGCLLIANRAFDRLPQRVQQALKAGAAKYDRRVEESGRETDEQLLGGLFAKQGLKVVPVSEAFRAEYFDETRKVRERIGDQLVPRTLQDRVLRMLADFRAQRGPQRR